MSKNQLGARTHMAINKKKFFARFGEMACRICTRHSPNVTSLHCVISGSIEVIAFRAVFDYTTHIHVQHSSLRSILSWCSNFCQLSSNIGKQLRKIPIWLNFPNIWWQMSSIVHSIFCLGVVENVLRPLPPSQTGKNHHKNRIFSSHSWIIIFLTMKIQMLAQKMISILNCYGSRWAKWKFGQ